MTSGGRYRVVDDDEEITEPRDFACQERAKAVALNKLAYGYRSRVLDLVTGLQVFPPADDSQSV